MGARLKRPMIIVGYHGAELLDIAGVTSSLDIANRLVATPYAVELVTPGGAPMHCDSGMVVAAHQSLERYTGAVDTLMVAGGAGHRAAAADTRIVGHVRRLAGQSRRIASVGTGASLLAAAGLLTGLRVTTHWRDAPRLAAAHPEMTVDPAPVFVRDEAVVTAAGGISAVDLTLSLIEEDHGPQLSRQVALHLLTYMQRLGHRTQMRMCQGAPATDDDLIRSLLDHIVSNLDHDLRTESLAARAGVSTRHLTRLFTRHVSETPARHVRRLRAEAAAELLVGTSLPVETIARRCGFGSAEALRQAFVVWFGVPPRVYRAVRGVRAQRSPA